MALRTLVTPLLCLVALAGCPAPAPPVAPPFARADVDRQLAALGKLPEGAMRVHMIDVGQGMATLVEFGCAAMLVDTGGEDNEHYRSVPQLLTYLEAFFASRPDLEGTLALLVITHPHIDHTRGAAAVFERFQVLNLVTDGHRRDDLGGAEQTALIDAAARKGIPTLSVRMKDVPPGGLEGPIVDPVACARFDPRIRVLWGGLGERDAPDWYDHWLENLNNHSVVVKVELGEASLLVQGDLQTPGIRGMIALHEGTGVLDADVFQIGHHGSPNAITPELMQEVSPEIALVPAGPAGRRLDWTAWKYGHPRRMVIEQLVRGVTGKRVPKKVAVAERVQSFVEMPIYKAVYASGWDGNVVVEMQADGQAQVTTGR